jgi:hypothetical protein
MRRVPYREAVGSLMYAAVGTQPDISFAVSTLSQFLDNPGHIYWEAVKRVLRYLLGTKELRLTFGGGKDELEGFTSAGGASQPHRRAISGHAFLINGGTVSWSSRKQERVTLSTAEAEYVAATHAAKEANWTRRFIGEIFEPIETPTTLYCDNQSAIALASNENYHARTKHIDIRYHSIRFVIESGSIRLVYCPTEEMTADTLTKAARKQNTSLPHSDSPTLEGECCDKQARSRLRTITSAMSIALTFRSSISMVIFIFLYTHILPTFQRS